MGSIKGTYGLNRDNIHTIFNNYDGVDKYWRLQEKPTNYAILRCDLDYKTVVSEYGQDDEEQPTNEVRFQPTVGDL